MYMQRLMLAACVLLLSSTILAQTPNEANWTFVIYMKASAPEMHYWANKNIHDMAMSVSDTQKLNIIVQIDMNGTDAWRYLICHNTIIPMESVTVGNDYVQELVDAMHYAVQNYPAKNYALILWGAGFGILDPTYQPTNTSSFPWDISADEPETVCTSGECPSKTVCQSTFCKQSLPHRGVLFDIINQSYMTNAQLVSALKIIQQVVLNRKKLAIFGADCCKMAMLEIAYELKDSADFLVGSQNCELIDGWNYTFFSCFNNQPLMEREVVEAIVTSYKTYYEKNTIKNSYTLSALDVSKIDPFVLNFNAVVTLSNQLLEQNKEIFKAMLLNARTNCPSMCDASYYLDLGQLYKNIAEELGKIDAGCCNTKQLDTLKKLLEQGQTLFKSLVVANATGTAVKKLQGISIYFPRNNIDASYEHTPFTQETAWISLLKKLME